MLLLVFLFLGLAACQTVVQKQEEPTTTDTTIVSIDSIAITTDTLPKGVGMP